MSLEFFLESLHTFIGNIKEFKFGKSEVSNCINPAKFFRLFYTKNLLFLFYIATFPKYSHRFIYFTIPSI